MRTGERPEPGGNGATVGMDAGPAASMRCPAVEVGRNCVVGLIVRASGVEDDGVEDERDVGVGSGVGDVVVMRGGAIVTVGVQVGAGVGVAGAGVAALQAASPTSMKRTTRNGQIVRGMIPYRINESISNTA